MQEIHSSSVSALAGRHKWQKPFEALWSLLCRTHPEKFHRVYYGDTNDNMAYGVRCEDKVYSWFVETYLEGSPSESQASFHKNITEGFDLVGHLDGHCPSKEAVFEIKCRVSPTFVDREVNDYDIDQLACYGFLTGEKRFFLVEVHLPEETPDREKWITRVTEFSLDEMLKRFEIMRNSDLFQFSLEEYRRLVAE